jgi:hypothetical protein
VRTERSHNLWFRRLKETLAVITAGDEVIELIAPREHSLLWHVGPKAPVRRTDTSPTTNYIRLLVTAQRAFDVWSALRQYRQG